jgi:cytidine deaminase
MTCPDDELVDAARAVRAHAWAPFSGFAVGAAVRHRSGRIITGCNVENATYGLTICAERVAVFKAISEGLRPDEFTAVAVVADTDEPTPPCGACRQILWEFCGDVPVILATPADVKAVLGMRELLPRPFDARILRSTGPQEPRTPGAQDRRSS